QNEREPQQRPGGAAAAQAREAIKKSARRCHFIVPFVRAGSIRVGTGFAHPPTTPHPGWNPFALNFGAACGPVRNSISALAAAGDLLSAPTAAVNTVVLASSPGSGPTSCAPATGTISEPCATPSSASPLATTSAA